MTTSICPICREKVPGESAEELSLRYQELRSDHDFRNLRYRGVGAAVIGSSEHHPWAQGAEHRRTWPKALGSGEGVQRSFR